MYIENSGLKIDDKLDTLLRDEILPGLSLDADQIWSGFSALLSDLAPKNVSLLKKRDDIQVQLDSWHKNNPGHIKDLDKYKDYLAEIGYLVPEGEKFDIETKNIDPEIAHIAGPQLVVPVNNARFALNAVNARWGSLFDALYGSDIIPQEGEMTSGYDPKRGENVISYACEFLDESISLQNGASHKEVAHYKLVTEASGTTLSIELRDGTITTLSNPHCFKGYNGDIDKPLLFLFLHNGLHIELHIDPDHPIGKSAPGNIKDVVMESALTTIQDCEDSVAAVDAEDKCLVYRNWLGLMKGDLAVNFDKGGKQLTRSMSEDRTYTDNQGQDITLSGRSLLLVRNVGHLMTNPTILLADGAEIPEGIMDALFTSLCALHDVKKHDGPKNSQTGSVYIVKPKMHGPEEAAFTNEIFTRVEELLCIPKNTLKVGVMDEERRTTVNLKETIRAVKERLVFINTGFLDRTGDEIHTSMMAGPVLPKEEIKAQNWIAAYEDWNVDIGLACGLSGKAQIGKGMWPKPDEMLQMMNTKMAHPLAGANCAWVPSPTAATLHAMHYHKVLVSDRQIELAKRQCANIDDILTPPIMHGRNLTEEEITAELENNAQGILGYVVRWINQGIGCSKVPDINDVGLMEDRATLRISSQHMANWLHHGICTKDQIMEVMKRMAAIVDIQNQDDPHYTPMAPDYNGIAFHSACALVLEGKEQPSGYTEPLLHGFRQKFKNTN